VAKTLNVGQNSKFCPNIESLIKNLNLARNQNLSFVILAFKHSNFGLKLAQKSKFLSKIEILIKNRNFGQKSKFWLKIDNIAFYDI